VSEEEKKYLVENNIPFVIINSYMKDYLSSIVKTDLSEAIGEAVSCLVDNYGDNIIYIGDNANSLTSPRFNNYKDSLAQKGIELRTENIIKSFNRELDDMEQVYEHFKDRRGCIFCDSATLAFKLIRYLTNKGKKIKDEIGIAAIGPSQFSEISNPSLSTIDAPLYDMGVYGCEMLFDILNNNPHKDVLTLKWFFVRRGSC
jgi:DNA-binding LacI/PurR family transcriptional regulator